MTSWMSFCVLRGRLLFRLMMFAVFASCSSSWLPSRQSVCPVSYIKTNQSSLFRTCVRSSGQSVFSQSVAWCGNPIIYWSCHNLCHSHVVRPLKKLNLLSKSVQIRMTGTIQRRFKCPNDPKWSDLAKVRCSLPPK
jgi:hypothetical protein